jgi:hypothetical protein
MLALCAVSVASTAQARVISNDKIDIPFFAFVSCADGGNGEFAEGVIRLHSLVRETFDQAGGVHFGAVFHPMGGELIGETTGDVYRAVGRTGDSTNIGAGDLPISTTFVNVFKLVGPGGGVSFTFHQNTHVTVNANGETTAEVENTRVTCD